MKPADNCEDELFREAIKRAPGQERAALLDQACAGNEILRKRLDALIQAHERSTSLLDPQVTLPEQATLRVELPQEEGSGTVIGRYKLLQRIGEGGMGIVYMAEQEEPVRRRVALKIIKLGMDTRQVVARFEVERQALALMDHPNIARVFDGGATETGRPYFVMELVQGVPITAFCDKNKLPTQERLKLFIQVCQAVQSAHQKAIIHRDLKPSNVLVTLHHGEPMAKVIDFGVAKATNQKLTEKTLFTNFATMIGTPAYMSPEQAEMSSLDIDTRTDVYSLGVLLYELLAGSTPFPDQRLRSLGYGEMQRVIMEEEPERPSTRLSTMTNEQKSVVAKNHGEELASISNVLKGDLDWIVMKCLEKDRRRRYETAISLAADLKRHLDNEPVTARPPSTAYRLQKAWRRNKLAFTAGAAVAAALVVGTGISTWQAVVATRAKAVEKVQRLAAQTERNKAQASQKEALRAQEAEASIRREAEHQLYVANMNLAQQAWEENNIGRLRQVLEDTKDSSYRGFEWYYWQQQIHMALKTLRGHLGRVTSVAYSPNGQRIVTGSFDATAKLWEAASGRELLTLKGHSDRIASVAYSPDGQRIVTGGFDAAARVWEAASGRELLTLKGGGGMVGSVAFSRDGQRIVTSTFYGTVKVWEAITGRELFALKVGKEMVGPVAFSPDGQRIVVDIGDATAKVWEVASGRELLILKGHIGQINSVAYSPDGQRIVTGGSDWTAKVWEATSGKELLTLKGHSGEVRSVVFSPDSQRIASGSYDGSAKLWEAVSGRELSAFKGHGDGVSSVDFSPDGQRIVTGSGDETAKVWELPIGLAAEKTGGNRLTLIGHNHVILCVAFSPDGQRVFTASLDKTAKVWEAASGRELLTLKVGVGLAFSADGQRVVTGLEDNTAKVWDVASGRELFALKGHRGMIISAAFSPDGQRIVSSSLDKTAKVWEATTGRELLTLKGHSRPVECAAFCRDGQRIVTCSSDKTSKVWEAATGRELLTLKGAGGRAAFSPDGQRIVTGTTDGKTARVWEAASGRELSAFNMHGPEIYSVAFSPDGQRIVTSSSDRAKVWETASGRELLTLKGHSGEVYSVAFSPDGLRIATGSVDNTAKLWEAARAEQVTGWEEEERAAAESHIARERERTAKQERQLITRDRDSIKQWLVLAPIALASGQSGSKGLDIEQIEGEGRLRPKAGEAVSVRGGKLKWRQVALEEPVIDFNMIFGQETTQSVAYAVSYLRLEAEQRGLQMLVGGDNEVKVYLNGKEVHKAPVPRMLVGEQDEVADIALNAGVNVLVFKVVKETGAWEGSICLYGRVKYMLGSSVAEV